MIDQEFVDDCIAKAECGLSKCSGQVLSIRGMTGIMTKHLYNNLLSLPGKSVYLEIGSHQGSSSVAALYKNYECSATLCDNWSEFGDVRDILDRNLDLVRSDPSWTGDLTTVYRDCFELAGELEPESVDVFLYDGAHDVDSQERAITEFWHCLKPRSLVLVDDYDWDTVRRGTEIGLSKTGANVVYSRELPPTGDNGFWNGCGIFLIEKAPTTKAR